MNLIILYKTNKFTLQKKRLSVLQFYTFAQVFSNLHFYTLLAQSFIHKTFMKINSLHLRLIHAWMCTKDHKCKCKQVWIDTFSHQEPALIQDSKVNSLYSTWMWTAGMRRIQGGKPIRNRSVTSLCQYLPSLFSTFLNSTHLYCKMKWNEI